jgi:hypothetical protein
LDYLNFSHIDQISIRKEIYSHFLIIYVKYVEVAIEYLPSTTNNFDIYMINTKDLFILFYDEFDIQFPLKV